MSSVECRPIGLLTWTAYGTWLPGPARGWIDAGSVQRDEPLPEPDPVISQQRRRSLKWPPAHLQERQRDAIIDELPRIARLRDFEPRIMVAASDHAHLLLATQRVDIPRLVQLIKGALSRRLTILAGDAAALSTSGGRLAHHKWWARQYSFRRIEREEHVQAVQRRLIEHPPPVSRFPGAQASGPPLQ